LRYVNWQELKSASGRPEIVLGTDAAHDAQYMGAGNVNAQFSIARSKCRLGLAFQQLDRQRGVASDVEGWPDGKTLWFQLFGTDKQRFQSALFPAGVYYSSEGFGTPEDFLFAAVFGSATGEKASLVDQTGVEPFRVVFS